MNFFCLQRAVSCRIVRHSNTTVPGICVARVACDYGQPAEHLTGRHEDEGAPPGHRPGPAPQAARRAGRPGRQRRFTMPSGRTGRRGYPHQGTGRCRPSAERTAAGHPCATAAPPAPRGRPRGRREGAAPRTVTGAVSSHTTVSSRATQLSAWIRSCVRRTSGAG